MCLCVCTYVSLCLLNVHAHGSVLVHHVLLTNYKMDISFYTYMVDFCRTGYIIIIYYVVAHGCKFVSDFDNLLDIERIIHVHT